MAILLNKELAIVGFIAAVVEQAIKENKGNGNNLSFDSIEVTPNDVLNYCNYLSLSDYGPILLSFNIDDCERLFNIETTIFKSKCNNKYIISLYEYKDILPDYNLEQFINELRKILIRYFIPDLNYPAGFLRFMKLCN